jgi:hypothetical protein
MNPNATNTSDRPASEMVREVTESSRQMFEAGERVMSNLTELQERAERTLDWPSRIMQNPVALLGMAVGGGVLLGLMFSGGSRRY